MTPLSPHNRFEMPRWLKVVLVFTFATNILAVVACAGLLYVNSTTDSSQGGEIRDLVDAAHADQLAACERGNETREAQIGDLRADLINLRGDLGLLRAVAVATQASPVADVYVEAVDAKERTIRRKRRTIRKTIEAQAPVAVEKGSPIVDCKNKAYSLQDDQQEEWSRGGTR